MIRKIYKVKATVAISLKFGSDLDFLKYVYSPFCYFKHPVKLSKTLGGIFQNHGWSFFCLPPHRPQTRHTQKNVIFSCPIIKVDKLILTTPDILSIIKASN